VLGSLVKCSERQVRWWVEVVTASPGSAGARVEAELGRCVGECEGGGANPCLVHL
jgi:hypothetical protein